MNKIKYIKFKNFRSYGNMLQTINLNTTETELIAIVGESGSGKTNIKEVFEYVLFGKTRSRRNSSKNVKLKTLPNNINKNLYTEILINIKGKDLLIKRGMNPGIFKLYLNGEEIVENKQYKIEKYLNINFELYQSFISFSQADLLNFTNLSRSNKDDIINKLFNYEYIINLHKKLEDILSHTINDKLKKETELNLLNKDYKKNKNKLIAAEKEVVIEGDLDGNKLVYTSLQEDVKALTIKENDLKEEMNKFLNLYYKQENLIKDLKNRISIHEQGKCPYCHTELEHILTLDLQENLNELTKQFENTENELKIIREKSNELFNNKTKLNNDISSLLSDTAKLKNSIELKSKIALLNVESLKETETELIKNITNSKKEVTRSNTKINAYKVLKDLLSNEGDLKLEILRKILPKVNLLIRKYVEKLNFEYTFEINEKIAVDIYKNNVKVDLEIPSNGEIKRINLIIMFSLITYSVFNSKLNLMFLDELLEGLDLKNSYKMIETLKSIVSDFPEQLNLYMICHKLNDYSNFDSMIKVEKNYFSSIKYAKI